MKKYCCNSFMARLETDRGMGLNIRIVKLTEREVFDKKELKKPYRVFLTEGYEIGQSNVKMALIKFCPFCGKEIERFYSLESYVNEDVKDLPR